MARTSKRATEATLELLHNLVTEDLVQRLHDGEHTTADIRAAIEWLKVNSITGVAIDNNPLNQLSDLIGGLDFSDVEAGCR
jgi:hypothetical protein